MNTAQNNAGVTANLAGSAAAEKLYRLMFERNLAGIFRYSQDGTVIDANDACAAMLGYSSRQELVGLRRANLFFDPSEAERSWERLQRDKVLANHEVCIKRKDGEGVWLLANLIWVDNGTTRQAHPR